jgi:hypothetical protein
MLLLLRQERGGGQPSRIEVGPETPARSSEWRSGLADGGLAFKIEVFPETGKLGLRKGDFN